MQTAMKPPRPASSLAVLSLLALLGVGSCSPPERREGAGSAGFLGRFADPALACDDAGHVYLAATESFRDRTQIFVATSQRWGEAWDARFQYVNTSTRGDRRRPQLATGSPGQVFVLWEDTRDGRVDLHFNRSLDAGRTWDAADRRINHTPTTSPVAAPVFAADARGNLVAVWMGAHEGFDAFYANRSRDAGTSWLSDDVRITGVSLSRKSVPRLLLDRWGQAYLVWIELDGGQTKVLFNRSQDHGEHWEFEARRIDTSRPGRPQTMQPPDIAVSESGVVVVTWIEVRSGVADIWMARSGDRGVSWDAPRVLRSSASELYEPSAPRVLSGAFSHLHIAWQAVTSEGKVRFILMSSEDDGRTWHERSFVRDGLTPVPRTPVGRVEVPRFRIAEDGGGNVYFTWLQNPRGVLEPAFERLGNHGEAPAAFGQTLGTTQAAPRSLEAPLLCVDDRGHVVVAWNAGSLLVTAASPFGGDSGWRYARF